MSNNNRPNTPKVSVILPVYNANRYLRRAIESILDQSYQNLEVIIIDDGSTDDSFKIIKHYADNDQRIIAITRDNLGLTHTLNEGLSIAEGIYVARMDSDDIAYSNRIEKQVRYLQKHPKVKLVGSSYLMINEHSLPIDYVNTPTNHDTITSMLLDGSCPISHPTVLFCREAIHAVGAYRKGYESAEDLELWLRLTETSEVSNLPDILMKYRIHPKSISASNQDQQISNTIKATNEARTRREIEQKISNVPSWRASSTRSSKYAMFCSYGWRAYKNSFFLTATYYSLQAIYQYPIRREAWILLAKSPMLIFRKKVTRDSVIRPRPSNKKL